MRANKLLMSATASLIILTAACGTQNEDLDGKNDIGNVDTDTDTDADAGNVEADAEPAVDAATDAGRDQEDLGPTHTTTIKSLSDLRDLQGTRGDAKYLAYVEGASIRLPLTEGCYFQNTALFPYHIQFLRSFPELAVLSFEEYVSLVLRRSSRIWWGGAMQFFPNVVHPLTQQPGVIVYTVYAETSPASELSIDDVVAADTVLRRCVTGPAEALAFLPSDTWQISLARRSRSTLASSGVGLVMPEELN